MYVLSLSAAQPNDFTPGYAACNAATVNLAHTIALQYADANVRANSILCGFSGRASTSEDRLSSSAALGDTDSVARRVVPLGRPNSGRDIGNAALWLISDDAAYLTGTELTLDGGRSAGIRNLK